LARLLAEITQSNIAVNTSLDLVNAADNSPQRKGKRVIHKEHVVRDVEAVLQCKVVYIVRDVRDVLVSWFFHCNRWVLSGGYVKKTGLYKRYFIREILKSSEILRGNIWSECLIKSRQFLELFIHRGYERVRIGDWSNHVDYWRNRSGVVVVRYEDLLKDTESELRKILAALDISVEDEFLSRCILNQSFENRKSEFLRSGDDKNVKFLRSGQAGDWRSMLPPSVVIEVERRHARVMNECGYKLEFYEAG